MKIGIEIVKLPELNFTNVSYYTLKFVDEDKNEFNIFLNNYKTDYTKSIQYLTMWIAEIGENLKAELKYFRTEDNAQALPPPSGYISTLESDVDREKMKLRLYCIVISPQIVILVNGGVKESQAVKDSPSCLKEFNFTTNIASQIRNMIKYGNFTHKGKEIITNNAFNLTYKK